VRHERKEEVGDEHNQRALRCHFVHRFVSRLQKLVFLSLLLSTSYIEIQLKKGLNNSKPNNILSKNRFGV
jgi:hypothetical protein